MKHLHAVTQSRGLPAKAIEIPEDIIRSVQDVDNFTGLAIEIVRLYVDGVINGTKEKMAA